MTVIFNIDGLLKEKQIHPNWIFFLGDKTKNPQTIVGKWKHIEEQTQEELEQLIQDTQKRIDVEAWNWGIRTGIHDIACLDFDWEFLYYRWLRKFGDRGKTTTYRTANKGYRVLFQTIETSNDNPYKNNLHTEFENKGYAVIGGYAEDEEGNKEPYQKLSQVSLYPDKIFCFANEISVDNTLIADTKKWLSEQLEHYDFLQYNCINSIANKKHIKLTHDQRLSILHFMLLKIFKDDEIHDFFRTIYDTQGRDYAQEMTQSQIQSGKEYILKEGKPHPCKPKQQENGHVSVPLYQVFNFNNEQCSGCIRRRTVEKTTTEIEMEKAIQDINNKFKIKCPVDTRELLLYNNGCYIDGSWRIEETLEEVFGDEMKSHFVEEVLKHLERQNFIEREEINKISHKIPVKNGLLNLNKLKLEKFDSKQIYTYKLNVDYDPEAKCKKFIDFIKDIQPEENDQKLLQEIMGYCLLPSMPFHKMFWFYGIGRNGKGRIILTLEHILGKENCSNLNLSDFKESRRFSLCHLYGKLLNTSSEPSPKYPLETANIKLATGEDTISAELKGKNKRLQFTNKAKLIVLGNRFPKVDDTSLGWWERVEVLKFPNSFLGDNNIPHIEKQWLENEKEVSGILNWMLEGLYRVIENKQFTTSKTTEETKTEFMKMSDPFNAWIKECCSFVPEAYLTRGEAYDHYKEYADSLGTSPDSTRDFYAKMRVTPKVKDSQIRINKKRERVFLGITINNEEEDINQQKLEVSQKSQESQEFISPDSVQKNNNIKNIVVPHPVTTGTSVTDEDKNLNKELIDGKLPVCFDCKKNISNLSQLCNLDGHIYCRECRNEILWLRQNEKK